jgi:hypothetical protein
MSKGKGQKHMEVITMKRDERENSALGRLEIVAETYLRGDNRVKKLVLSFLEDNEKDLFLEYVGMYHLLTDKRFHDVACKTVGEQLYKEFNEEG